MIFQSNAHARTIKNFAAIKNNVVAKSLLKSLQDLTLRGETLSVRGLPLIVMHPTVADLTGPIHTSAHACWTRLRSGDRLPPAADIDPQMLQPALGWIALLEPVEDCADFVCRLFGSEIAWRFDVELTGRQTSTMMADLAPFVIACCRACMAARAPVLVQCQLTDPACDQGDCLLLPWADPEGQIVRIMAVLSLKERAEPRADRPNSALVRFKR